MNGSSAGANERKGRGNTTQMPRHMFQRRLKFDETDEDAGFGYMGCDYHAEAGNYTEYDADGSHYYREVRWRRLDRPQTIGHEDAADTSRLEGMQGRGTDAKATTPDVLKKRAVQSTWQPSEDSNSEGRTMDANPMKKTNQPQAVMISPAGKARVSDADLHR
uniref:OCRE domain-containing protein n=1 Tax=Panagrellus redivivus TaxID=6233 RepID=A0A7E4W1A4_PANRE